MAMIETTKRFKITCSKNPATTLIIMRKETPESLKCLICHQEQGVSGKGNCMSISASLANEPVAKTRRASRDQAYPCAPVALSTKKAKGRFGKRSTKSRVVYAHV